MQPQQIDIDQRVGWIGVKVQATRLANWVALQIARQGGTVIAKPIVKEAGFRVEVMAGKAQIVSNRTAAGNSDDAVRIDLPCAPGDGAARILDQLRQADLIVKDEIRLPCEWLGRCRSVVDEAEWQKSRAAGIQIKTQRAVGCFLRRQPITVPEIFGADAIDSLGRSPTNRVGTRPSTRRTARRP